METIDDERDEWSTLPSDLLPLILNNLNARDYLRSRLTCKSWGSADAPHRPTKTTHAPFLFFPTHDPHLGNLFTLDDQNLRPLRLPQGTPGLALLGSSNGWLAYACPSTDLHLINPLTSARLPLPPITTLSAIKQVEHEPDGRTVYRLRDCPAGCVVFHPDKFYKKVAVFSPPSSSSSSIVTFIVHGIDKALAFARPGDETWTEIITLRDVQDIVRHEGLFYAVRHGGEVVTIDISVCPPRVAQVSQPPCSGLTANEDCFLVELEEGKELLQVRRREYSGSCGFRVLRLDSDKKRWVDVERLDGAALFLGRYQSMSVPVKDYSPETLMKENCIYFTDLDGNRIRADMEVFSLKDRAPEPAAFTRDPRSKLQVWPRPFWFMPTL